MEIYDELELEEAHQFKFLVRDKVSRNVLNGSLRDIFLHLKEKEIISQSKPQFLIDCLCLLDQDRLAEEVRKVCGIENVGNPEKKEYRFMIYKFGLQIDDMNTNDLKDMLHSREYINKVDMDEARSIFDLFCLLENNDCLDPKDHVKTYRFLKDKIIPMLRNNSPKCKYILEKWYQSMKDSIETDGEVSEDDDEVETSMRSLNPYLKEKTLLKEGGFGKVYKAGKAMNKD